MNKQQPAIAANIMDVLRPSALQLKTPDPSRVHRLADSDGPRYSKSRVRYTAEELRAIDARRHTEWRKANAEKINAARREKRARRKAAQSKA